MARFFFSYRRKDAESDAGRIADRFRAAFGDDDVFVDTAAIDAGDRWRDRIDAALEQAETVFVVIGAGWATIAGADGRPRLHAADDVVAHEIARAIGRGIRVVPVRVQGAALPDAAVLPPPLRPLLDHNDFEVRSGPAFDRDVAALVDSATGRRSGWRRLRPRGAAAAVVAAVLVTAAATALLYASRGDGSGAVPAVAARAPGTASATAAATPVAFDLQLQLRLRQVAGDDRQLPDMKLWHRKPSPGRAGHINLLDQARALSPGLLEYVSPIPAMPADGDEYEGLMHRLVLTGQANEPPTQVCFIADLAAAAAAQEPTVRLDCAESERCRVVAAGRWARSCPAPRGTAWLPFVGNAFAAAGPAVVWSVPSLATLQSAANAGRAWSEITLVADPAPSLREAAQVTLAVFVNRQAIHVDGLPPEAYPQPYDAARGLQLRFGLENLDASGLRAGYDDLRVELSFLSAAGRPLRSVALNLPYIALRNLHANAPLADADLRLRWRADYHAGRSDDAFQIFIGSARDATGLAAHKKRFDAASLAAEVGGRSVPLVAVLRPPYAGNPSFGLNVGMRQPNGQVRFSFDARTSAALCAGLMRIAAERPGLVRRDAYRRTLDGRRGHIPCATSPGA